MLAGLVGTSGWLASTPSGASPPPGAPACPILPADNIWHADVSGLPVHPRSDAWLAAMGGPGRRLHPDFGPSDDALPYGIPYDVVDGSVPKVGVVFDYDDESDPGPYPFGASTTVEGGSDRHALVIDRDACVLYELYAADWNGGAPMAGSGAVFDLRSNDLRPSSWTSADAAGLPIFPGLLRLDEVQAGHVDHAIRITASRTDRSFVWPARHQAGAADDPNLPPMGAWFRMRADVDLSGYRPETQVILNAFKTHGAVVADNGSNWYFTGSADQGWDEEVLNELKSIPAGSFEAVDSSGLMVSADSGQARAMAAPPLPAPPAPASTPSSGGEATSGAGAPPPPAPVVTGGPGPDVTGSAASTTGASSGVTATPSLAVSGPDGANRDGANRHGRLGNLGPVPAPLAVAAAATAGAGAWLGYRRRWRTRT